MYDQGKKSPNFLSIFSLIGSELIFWINKEISQKNEKILGDSLAWKKFLNFYFL
jgi:hypothetical protein